MNIFEKCNKLQKDYGGGTSEEKIEAKRIGVETIDKYVKGDIIDIGGHDFYKEFSKNNIINYNFPNDMHKLDEKEKYDGALAMHVLEHSPFPLLVLDNIYKALKPNGYLYVAVPKPTKYFEIGIVDHITMMSGDMWEKIIKIAGFEIIERTSGTFNPNDNWIENRFLCKK